MKKIIQKKGLFKEEAYNMHQGTTDIYLNIASIT